jgi:mRNA interferase MazF
MGHARGRQGLGKFIKGDIVVIPFPFSDLSGNKRRPACVIKDLPGNDVILCQITSSAKSDASAIPITIADFASGFLKDISYIRTSKIFTAEKNLILLYCSH